MGFGEAKCKLEMQLAGRAKMTGRECRHLLQINNASYPETVSLHDNKINELGQDNQFRILKNETISKCIALNLEAVREHAPTVVQWQDGNCIHMSVYDSSVQSRPLKMRCIVTFHIQNGQLDCQCGQNKYFCIHRAMALWFLNETNQLQSSITEVIENAEPYASSSDDVDSSNLPEKPAVFGNFVYPPQEINAITSMCTYLKNNKQIPVYIPQDIISISNESIPKAFLPVESLCHQCNMKLKGPFLFPKMLRF